MREGWHPRRAILLAVAMLGSPPALAVAQTQTCQQDASKFHAVIEEFQSRQQNVGLSVAVLAADSIVFEEAFGLANRESRIPATTETLFGVASVTKALTGLALLKAAEAGLVDLDAEVQRYVTEFPVHPDAVVTLRHLAAHLGGVRHWGDERNEALYRRTFHDVEEILPLFEADPFRHRPGREYSYSSYGYNLLAIALQRASGTGFQDYVTTTVIEPLGLTSIAFDRPGFGGSRRAARYSWYDLDDFDEVDAPVRVPDRDYTHNMAGGNMVATPADLARLGGAVLDPGFLGRSSFAQLWTRPDIDGVESPMSFGWFVRPGGNRLAISGSNAGLQAGMAVWRAERVVVVVLANSWGIGSRSAELMDDGAAGLLGRLAALCLGEGD